MGATSSRARAASTSTSTEASPKAFFEDLRITIDEQDVPVSVWWPANGSEGACVTAGPYSHKISLAKITSVLFRLGRKLPTFLDKELGLEPGKGICAGDSGSVAGLESRSSLKAVILCHGYLGSRFDLVDLAEGLAKSGFVVAAPEFAESLSCSETLPKASQDGIGIGAARDDILREVQAQVLSDRFGIKEKSSISLVGHSAGAGTAVLTRGRFGARVAIAGFRKQQEDAVLDPLLVIASEGDNVIGIEGINASVASVGFAVPQFDSPRSLSASMAGDSEAPRTAFLKYAGPASPCHISFLSSRTNEAMVQVLAPLLPVARLLGVPLLDFDVYEQTRDSSAISKDLIPAVTSWLLEQMAT
ncbi:hypothetical protein HOP50_14g73040 [Chloropicon primus]|uniref:Chlorophyllase n=1 Tax=Chloropicon primus TaxID=1764295 RepID=A0A5B8MWF8_9CHLO|nr:hypothetical protein A3770_14p72850 [Chloropicon primus]UPR03973.1 hypothetical protein HOP50_14g73040 [Chloropicon primus]|eukprot:QDZ24767.1 hypothetical protein A3770_14p72850 [Chloropicon primus]